jgi:hypothetical protein
MPFIWPPLLMSAMYSAYEYVPPWKEALSSTRCQKKRDSTCWSPSRQMTSLPEPTLASLSPLTMEVTRLATSLPLSRSFTAAMLAPSRVASPNRLWRSPESTARPTHRYLRAASGERSERRAKRAASEASTKEG